jgi:hypothetical protein
MLLKKFLLTGMAVLLSVSFILTGCPTDSDDGGGGPADNTGTIAARDFTVSVLEGNNKLVVTATEGSLAAESDIKVYVKNDGTAVTISTGSAPAGFAEAAGGYQVSETGLVITVAGLAPADGGGTAGVLKAGPVTVTLAADAQVTQVAGITAVSLKVAAVSTGPVISVTADDDTLKVEVTGGSLVAAGDLKVYVNATFDEVVITKAVSLTGYTPVTSARASVAGGVITVSGLAPATAGGTAGVLKAGDDVTVTLEADAQVTPVTGITAESSNSGNAPVTDIELAGAGIVPYSAVPNGGAAAPANLGIGGVDPVITGGTVAAAAYVDVNGSDSFDGGDTQEFTITLTAASGHTFANTGIAPGTVAAAALDPAVFTADAIGGSAAIAETSVTTLVVTVTYTNQGQKDTVITSAGLAAAGIAPYDVPPAGTSVNAPIIPGDTTVISAVNVAAALHIGPWAVGATQDFTITLTAADGHTFVGAGSLNAGEIVAAVLGDSFTRHISEGTGTPANPYVVTVTYTKPAVITTAELAGIEQHNTRPDGVAFGPKPLEIPTGNPAIASGTLAAAAGTLADPAAGWAVGDRQEFTIRLTAADGHTFAGAGGLTAAQIAGAVLGPLFTGHIAPDGAAADSSFVVTALYTRPADTVITKANLDAAQISQYNTEPAGTAFGPVPLTITGDATIIKSGTLAAAAGTSPGGGTWGPGSQQVFTIKLEREPNGYTFADTSSSLTAQQVVDAVLGTNFTGQITADRVFGVDDSFEVTVRYTKPNLGSQTVNAGFDDSVILGTPAPAYNVTAKTVTAAIRSGGGYTGIKWYIDGVPVEDTDVTGTGSNYVLSIPGGLSAKTHSLTVRATKGGISYSQTVAFTAGQ